VQYAKSYEDKEWDELLDTYTEFQGSENTGKIMVVDGLKKEDFFVNRLESSGMEKMYESTSTRVKQSIRQRFGQPPSILGVRDSSNAMFSSQNIEDDTKFYNSITTDERMLIEQDTELLFTNFHIPINATGDYSILELTFNAIASELPSLVSKIGFESMTQITGILSSSLDRTVKINLLEIGFGLTNEQAQKLVLPIPATA
jgi:hypothetical protein